jgi:hypothetical protein
MLKKYGRGANAVWKKTPAAKKASWTIGRLKLIIGIGRPSRRQKWARGAPPFVDVPAFRATPLALRAPLLRQQRSELLLYRIEFRKPKQTCLHKNFSRKNPSSYIWEA